jgi:hypothetical protein
MDSTMTSPIEHFISVGAQVITLLVGCGMVIAFIYGISKGGFRFLKAVKKIIKFVDRVECLVDDFWPEVLSGLEKKGFISIGSSARWTSMQAKILKSHSPIQITDAGNKLIKTIGFDKVYDDNSSKFISLLNNKLSGTTDNTDFDIEQVSLKLVADLFDISDPLIKCAENYSFNHPNMPISQLKSLLGIYLRDKIINDPEMRKQFGLSEKKG